MSYYIDDVDNNQNINNNNNDGYFQKPPSAMTRHKTKRGRSNSLRRMPDPSGGEDDWDYTMQQDDDPHHHSTSKKKDRSRSHKGGGNNRRKSRSTSKNNNNNNNSTYNQRSRSKSQERRRRMEATAKNPIVVDDLEDDDDDDDGGIVFMSKRNNNNNKKKKNRKREKTRQEQIHDDLYNNSDYRSVDDGIIGCADDLCVNKHDYMAEEDDYDAQLDSSYAYTTNKNSGIAGINGAIDRTVNNGKTNQLKDDEEVYIVHQRYGYFSILFGITQTAILAVMMWQCGIAPMNINPMFGPYPDALSEWGGKNSILIVEDGEWWRLMTPILLHAGVIHLFCNVAVQLELGVFFEREWGSMTWLIIYLTSALGSSVLSVITMPDAVSVGSSGAVMGLFGAKLAEVICRCCEKQDTAQDRVAHEVRKEQCVGVTCSVIVVMAFSFMPYVDWAAHLGGLLAGFSVGFMCFSIHMESFCLRLLWFVVGMALTLGFLIPCIDIMYSGDIAMNEELRDVCGYYTQNFDDYECNCMREEFMENLKNNNYFNNDDDGGGGGGGDGDGERFLYSSSWSETFQYGY